MPIKIPVSASIDPSAVAAEIDKLGQTIAKANKSKYEPVSKGTVANLDEVERKFRSLLQLNREMSRRLNVSGQSDKGFFDVDWSKAYDNNKTRAKKMAEAFQYVTNSGFSQAGGSQGGRGAGGAVTNAVAGATQAGLRAANGATGGVSGVVANSMGAGMSAGVGAGLAGLLGGILALGVGKIVSAATEKLDEAEANAWSNDQLKRVLGDVQVSFRALQGTVNSASENIHVTYSEGAKLATQFAKLGNLTAEQYKTLGGEIETGGGLSKSFGLDPSQGVGFMGQMRGARLTQDEQGSRKLALIIGETIAKSNAFSKADEVMDAIASYATAQARSSLSANISGYSGALAGLTGSGMVGLDVAGSASILNRANSSLTQGGAKGESSQFFSAAIGAKHGLDPYQLQMWREGGAFATLDSTFGKGTMADKFGMKGPGGKETWMEATLNELRGRYKDPAQLANATSNHLGLSMSQSMAMLQYKPAEIGDMQKRLGNDFDLKNLNASAIGTMGRIMTGDDKTLSSVAGDLRGRKDLTSDERERLDTAMSSGNKDLQKDVLMRLVASREQEETDGKNIHDSKVALDNLKTDMATKLIPLTQSIRDGILYMAGGSGKESRYQVTKKIEELESSDRVRRINSSADADDDQIKKDAEKQKMDVLMDPNADGGVASMKGWKEMQQKIKDGTATPDEMEDFKKRLELRYRSLGAQSIDSHAADRMAEIERQQKAALEESAKRRGEALKTEGENKAKRLADIDAADRAQLDAPTSAKSVKDFDTKEQRDNVAAFLDTIGNSEGAGYNTLVGDKPGQPSLTDLSQHPNKVGLVTGDGPSTAAGKYQILHSTWAPIAKRLGLKDFEPESQDKAAIEILRERGALDDVLSGDFHSAAKKLGSTWQSMPTGTSVHQGKRSWEYFDHQMEEQLKRRQELEDSADSQAPGLPDGSSDFRESKGPSEFKKGIDRQDLPAPETPKGTPLPKDGPAGNASAQRFIFDASPIEVIHKNERGEPVAPRQTLATTVKPASPFGTQRVA